MPAMNHYSASERFIFLLLGVFCLWDARRGLSTGTVWLKFGSIKRSDLAPLFWFGIGINVILGIVLLLGFVFGTDVWK